MGQKAHARLSSLIWPIRSISPSRGAWLTAMRRSRSSENITSNGSGSGHQYKSPPRVLRICVGGRAIGAAGRHASADGRNSVRSTALSTKHDGECGQRRRPPSLHRRTTTTAGETLAEDRLSGWNATFSVSVTEPTADDIQVDISVPLADAAIVDFGDLLDTGDLTAQAIVRKE